MKSKILGLCQCHRMHHDKARHSFLFLFHYTYHMLHHHCHHNLCTSCNIDFHDMSDNPLGSLLNIIIQNILYLQYHDY